MPAWTPSQSAELYGIPNWGEDYFSVGSEGHVQVHPRGSEGPALDLFALVNDLRVRGLHTPLVLRFSEILESRARALGDCFARAMKESDYRGRYRGVYPIKVNQQRQVVEELVSAGRDTALGLEVGSKAELLVAIALLDTEGALLVCNGYKDTEYVELALLAQKLGRYPILVLEQPDELELVLKSARSLGVKPHIGVRARLTARGAGRWVDSSGDRAKFGLSVNDIVQVSDRLRREDLLDALELVHFHLGSQVTAIRPHKDALREASRIFVGLCELGATMRFLDVGGGLGVDYDGSKSRDPSSMNYSLQEYASDVVSSIAEVCDDRDVPHPDIVTEAGRALVAHASVLVFDVLGIDQVPTQVSIDPPARTDHRVLQELHEIWSDVACANAQEAYHDATALKEEGTQLFSLGYLDLAARARIDVLYWSTCRRIAEAVRQLEHVPEDLAGLERALSDTYYGNFSVFQSLPDTWTMGQLFPVLPLHRLDERPQRLATLGDLTCDSDGKLDRFIDRTGPRDVLPLHAPNGAPYFLGVFLVGAYQETLGELHNLFGDTDAVHIHVEDDGTPRIEQLIEGDRVHEVLSYVQFDRGWLAESVRRATETALRVGTLTLEESALLRRRYEKGLAGSTYLDRENERN